MAQKTTVGFCRGSRVCPTEAIRNHAKKNKKQKKFIKLCQNRSIVKRWNVEQVFL
jgi:hypothetical protein